MLRLERKRIKTEKEERALLAAVDVTREVTGSIVKGAFDTLANGFTAIGQIGRGVAENPDPVAQAVSLGAAVGSILWIGVILESNKYTKPIGDFLQFDKLINGLKTLPGVAATVVDTIGNIGKQEAQLLGRDDKLGIYAIAKGSTANPNGTWVYDSTSVRYYTNVEAAAAALLVLKVVDPGDWRPMRRYWIDSEGYLLDAHDSSFRSVLFQVTDIPPTRRGSFYSDDQLRAYYPSEYTVIVTQVGGRGRSVYFHSKDGTRAQQIFTEVSSYDMLGYHTLKDIILYNPLRP